MLMRWIFTAVVGIAACVAWPLLLVRIWKRTDEGTPWI